MTNKKLAVVLLSGGMDSCLCAAIAKQEGYDLAALHLNYGQRTQEREHKAFNDICEYYNIEHRLMVDVGYFSQIGGSSLTDSLMDVPAAELGTSDIPNSYVPFRNGNIIAMAASWAEVLGAKALVVGAMEQDSSGYPDCRRSFFHAMESAINLGTKPDFNLKILTPLIDLTKKDIVTKSMELNAPIHLTWSCYTESEVACGVCESCALRLRGFRYAGIQDPLEYKIRPEYS